MNILVVGKYYTEAFALHISETLEAMGHAVRRFEAGVQSDGFGRLIGYRMRQVREVLYSTSDNLPAIRAARMKRLWRVAEEGQVDLVISTYDYFWPGEVAELKRRTHAQVALWYPDSCANFGRAFFMNAPYDGLFFKDPYIVHVLGGVLKSPVYYLPECFNPARHSLPEDQIGNDPAYRCQIATAGGLHSYRVAFFGNLADFDVKVWGTPAPLWLPVESVAKMYQGRGVYNHDKVRAFRGADILLNNLLYSEVWGVNARCFEAAGAGAFQMVDWRPGLNQLFEEGKELVAFRGIADLREKIGYWLPREQERKEIAAAGQQRAYREHTYALRLDLLIKTMTGAGTGYPFPSIHSIGSSSGT
jgi:spore maturation protein CgeB